VQPAEFVDFGTPWQVQTRVTGQALGQPERAEELVGEVEARFAQVRAAHPELEGRTIALSGPTYEGNYPFNSTADTRTRFFGALGMVVPPELDAAAGGSFYGTVSRENASMLDADVLVWQVGSAQERAGIESDPVLAALPAVREGRALFMDGTDYGALQFSSVLSLPHLLDEFVPRLAAAGGRV
jgi:iron complex transport system substrate-binding protein